MEEEKLWIGHRKHEIDKEMRTRYVHFGHQLLAKQHDIWEAVGSDQWTGYQSFGQRLLAKQHDTGKAVGSDQANVHNNDAFNYGGFNHKVDINPEHPVDIDQLEVWEKLKADSIKNTAEHWIADVHNSGTLDYGYGEYIRRSARLGINSTSDYEDFVLAKIMHSIAKLSGGTFEYGEYMRAKYLYAKYMHVGGTPLYSGKYEEYMRASAKLHNNRTSEYGECMLTRAILDGTFDYEEEYMRAKYMYAEYMHAGGTPLYSGKYEEYMLASAKLRDNGTSEYGECMPTRTTLDGTFGLSLHLNKVGLYLKEKILGSNEDNANIRNGGTIDYGEIMPANGRISKIELQKICEKTGMDAALLEEKSQGSDQYNSCFPVTTKNVCSLHPIFQSLLNSLKAAAMSVPPYFLSRCEQLKIWMGLKADSTKNTEEHYTENREVGNFPLPSLPEDNSLTYKDFMCYMRDNMLTIDPRYHVALLILCNTYLSSQIKNTTAPSENFQWDKSQPQTQPLLLTFGEAHDKFFPVIADIMMFMCCWFFTLVLIWIVNTGVLEIFSIFLCIAAPYFFFSELGRLATKTGVSCGSIKLPAFWFTVLAAVGISSMFVLATLVMSYTRWRLSNGKPRVGDVDGAILEGLPEVLQG